MTRVLIKGEIHEEAFVVKYDGRIGYPVGVLSDALDTFGRTEYGTDRTFRDFDWRADRRNRRDDE